MISLNTSALLLVHCYLAYFKSDKRNVKLDQIGRRVVVMPLHHWQLLACNQSNKQFFCQITKCFATNAQDSNTWWATSRWMIWRCISAEFSANNNMELKLRAQSAAVDHCCKHPCRVWTQNRILVLESNLQSGSSFVIKNMICGTNDDHNWSCHSKCAKNLAECLFCWKLSLPPPDHYRHNHHHHVIIILIPPPPHHHHPKGEIEKNSTCLTKMTASTFTDISSYPPCKVTLLRGGRALGSMWSGLDLLHS